MSGCGPDHNRAENTGKRLAVVKRVMNLRVTMFGNFLEWLKTYSLLKDSIPRRMIPFTKFGL